MSAGWTGPRRAAGRGAEDSILHPDNPPIELPSWQYVTATGNINSKQIEDAINTYDGQVVLFPMFDLTCARRPRHRAGQGRTGLRLRRHRRQRLQPVVPLPAVRGVPLEHAYINGNDKAHCDTGNGATSCLIGRFVDFISTGTVGPASVAGRPTARSSGRS